MKNTIIQQIDERVNSNEYNNFPLTKNRLVKIRGKLLHHIKLSIAEKETLINESFLI